MKKFCESLFHALYWIVWNISNRMICDTILESWRTCRWTASSWWWRNSAWSWPPPPTSPHSLSGWSTSTFQYGSQNVVIFIHNTNMHLKYSGTKGLIKSKIKRQILFISFCSRLFQMHICNVYKKIYNLWPILKVEVLHPDKECVEVGGGGQLHDGLLHHKDEADHLQVRQLFKVVSHINRFEIFHTIQKRAWHLSANEWDRERFCLLLWWVLDYAWRRGEIWLFWKHRFLSPCTLCPWIMSPSVSPARVRG